MILIYETHMIDHKIQTLIKYNFQPGEASSAKSIMCGSPAKAGQAIIPL